MATKKETDEYNSVNLQAVLDFRDYCSGMIGEIRGNFDSFNFEEQLAFDEAAYYYELAILDLENYISAYNKYFKQRIEQSVYRVIQGDTLVSIAVKFYGDPTKWEDIYLYNQLVDLDLTNVSTLIIPTIELDSEFDTDLDTGVDQDLF